MLITHTEREIVLVLPRFRVVAVSMQRLQIGRARITSIATDVVDLDPIIMVRHDDRYWTPNGNHRLQALRKLGAKSVTALVVPEPEIAFKILALNTEKAHNLREKSLEAIAGTSQP